MTKPLEEREYGKYETLIYKVTGMVKSLRGRYGDGIINAALDEIFGPVLSEKVMDNPDAFLVCIMDIQDMADNLEDAGYKMDSIGKAFRRCMKKKVKESKLKEDARMRRIKEEFNSVSDLADYASKMAKKVLDGTIYDMEAVADIQKELKCSEEYACGCLDAWIETEQIRRSNLRMVSESKKTGSRKLREAEAGFRQVTTSEELTDLLAAGEVVYAKRTGPFGEDEGAEVVAFGKIGFSGINKRLWVDESEMEDLGYESKEEYLEDFAGTEVIVLDNTIGQSDCNFYMLDAYSVGDLDLYVKDTLIENRKRSKKSLKEGWCILNTSQEDAAREEPSMFGDLTRDPQAPYDACAEIEKWLSERGFWWDDVECVNPENDGFHITIKGDWKHDHLRLNHEIWDKFHLCFLGNDEVYDSDGGDSYTAVHYYINPKKNDEYVASKVENDGEIKVRKLSPEEEIKIEKVSRKFSKRVFRG